MIIMKNRLWPYCPLLILALVVLLAASTPVQQADPARYLNDIKSLASPEMEGRGAGTKGLTRSEHLIEQRYKGLGLRPAGTGSSYLQPFTVVTGSRLKAENLLHSRNGSARTAL